MALEIIIEFVLSVLSSLGYMGVFVLMILESMIFPIPSEAVMPFAGFLVARGEMNFFAALLFSAAGTLVGSLLSYWIGIYGGRPFLLRYGKYFLLHETDLVWTESFFQKYGEKTVFIARFIPVVRHVVSIPCGMARMNLLKFSAYTFFGGLLWNAFLLYLGFVLGERWSVIGHYTRVLDVLMILVILVGIAFFVWHHRKRKRSGVRQL